MQTPSASRFNDLVELYYQPVFRFAASLCGKPDVALALTQHTFRVAKARGANPPAPVNVKQWLFTLLFLQFLEIRPRHGENCDKREFA
jgi:DNA-directed RNA polymerase specialized sigma24 family protein